MPRLVPGALVAWLLLASPALAAELTGGPLVGWTTDERATIWVRADGPCKVAVRWKQAGAPADAAETEAVATDANGDHTAVVALTGLAPEMAYEYSLLVDGKPTGTKAGGQGPWTFRTHPRPGTGKVSIAFGSCVHLGRFPVQPVFDACAALRPSAFVFLGDNVYYSNQDAKDRQKMWQVYRAQRECPSMAKLIASTPMYAQWDDHDYGPNDSDRTYPLKEHARDVFRAYWPAPSYGEEGQGIQTKHSIGPVDLFLVDDRTFRDPNKLPSTPDKTMMGVKQREWLIAGLAASKAPVKLVATASQFLARYHGFESWQLAREERDLVLDAIRDKKVQGVLFISGDRHLCEVVRYPKERVGYQLWDVTSSPLANRLFEAGVNVHNPDRVFVSAASNNFGLITVDAGARKVTLELRDEQGKVLWSAEPDDLLGPAEAPAPPAGGKKYF